MIKKWTKVTANLYQLSTTEKVIGRLELFVNSAKSTAMIHLDNEELQIERIGFWKSNIIVTDQNKNIIAKIYYDKWYASNAKLDYNNITFTLLTRNNPLLEWVIKLDTKEVLSYGLNGKSNNGMINIKITTAACENVFLFDFILWYLFLPVATEQMSDQFLFSNTDA